MNEKLKKGFQIDPPTNTGDSDAITSVENVIQQFHNLKKFGFAIQDSEMEIEVEYKYHQGTLHLGECSETLKIKSSSCLYLTLMTLTLALKSVELCENCRGQVAFKISQLPLAENKLTRNATSLRDSLIYLQDAADYEKLKTRSFQSYQEYKTALFNLQRLSLPIPFLEYNEKMEEFREEVTQAKESMQQLLVDKFLEEIMEDLKFTLPAKGEDDELARTAFYEFGGHRPRWQPGGLDGKSIDQLDYIFEWGATRTFVEMIIAGGTRIDETKFVSILPAWFNVLAEECGWCVQVLPEELDATEMLTLTTLIERHAEAGNPKPVQAAYQSLINLR